jgi:hypothetical protein
MMHTQGVPDASRSCASSIAACTVTSMLAKRKFLLQGHQPERVTVTAHCRWQWQWHGVDSEHANLRCAQGLGPVHVIRLKVLVQVPS